VDGAKAEAFAAQDIRNHLARVLSSERFAGKKRLSPLLRFLVEETLEGRGAEIKGYAVGHEVFRLGTEFDPQTNSIVRVAVKRLRAALSDYYQTTGRTDPVRISLPVGSYTPEFRLRPSLHRAPDSETEGLYNDANALLHPASSKARLLAARQLFEFLMELEPNFPGGFAGTALTCCLAVLCGHSDKREEDLGRGVRLARQALNAENAFDLGHAALGSALALSGDMDRARVEADLAVEHGPTNPWAHAWRGLIYSIAGDPSEAICSAQEALRLDPDRIVWLQ